MSWDAENWARQQLTGHPVRKAVLVGIANWMNPRGDPCQVSMRRLADEVEVNVRTVQRYVQQLEELGLVEKVETLREDGGQGWNTFRFPTYKASKVSHVKPAGKRPKPHDNLSAPPRQSVTGGHDNLSPGEGDKLSGGERQPCHGEGDTAVTPESEERSDIKTPQPPEGADADGAKRNRGERISETWTPPAIEDLPPAAKAKARQWPKGAYESEAEAFRDYWLGEGRAGARKLDWNRTWCNRINEATARVLRDAKAGVRFDLPIKGDGTVPVVEMLDTSRECQAAKKIRVELSGRLGANVTKAWFDPARLDIHGVALTVVAASAFMSSYQRDNFSDEVRRSMHAVLGPDAELEWRVERIMA